MTIRYAPFFNVAQKLGKPFYLLFIFIGFSVVAQAQYFIKNPSYDKRENSNIDIEAIRFFPDSLVIDFSYYGDPSSENPGYKINPGTQIELRNLDGFSKIEVSDLVNAKFYDYTYVKKKKTELFSVIFPFSLFNLLVKGDVEENVYEVFTAENPFNLNFIECSSNYRTANKIAMGNCFNFSNIKVNLPAEHWSVLYCSGYLNSLLKKGEFETSAQYKKRTSADTVLKDLDDQIESLYDLFSTAYIVNMEEPEGLVYNADREEFTVQYKGAENAVVFMPLAQAPTFKSKMEGGKYKLVDADLVRLSNGTHFIEKLVYEEKETKKKVELQNRSKLKSNPKKEFHDKVMSDLKRYYTAYKNW